MKLRVKSASFSTHNSQISRSYIFTVFPKSSQNIQILQISLKLHEQRGGYLRKKLLLTILEEQFQVPRNTAASK